MLRNSSSTNIIIIISSLEWRRHVQTATPREEICLKWNFDKECHSSKYKHVCRDSAGNHTVKSQIPTDAPISTVSQSIDTCDYLEKIRTSTFLTFLSGFDLFQQAFLIRWHPKPTHLYLPTWMDGSFTFVITQTATIGSLISTLFDQTLVSYTPALDIRF